MPLSLCIKRNCGKNAVLTLFIISKCLSPSSNVYQLPSVFSASS